MWNRVKIEYKKSLTQFTFGILLIAYCKEILVKKRGKNAQILSYNNKFQNYKQKIYVFLQYKVSNAGVFSKAFIGSKWAVKPGFTVLSRSLYDFLPEIHQVVFSDQLFDELS